MRPDRLKFVGADRCGVHAFCRVSHRVIECEVCGLRRVKDFDPAEKLKTAPESSKDYVRPMNYTAEEKRAKRNLGGLPGGEMPRRR